MQMESFFLTTAEIAVVLIGFVTIFLTFVMSGKDIGKADRMHGRALLSGSYPLLFVPFVPVAAYAYGASEATALFSFHLAGVLSSVMIGAVMMGFYSRLSLSDVREVGWVHTVWSFALGWGTWGFFLAGALGYAPAGNAVVAVILAFMMTGTALFSFAAQQLDLFDWTNP